MQILPAINSNVNVLQPNRSSKMMFKGNSDANVNKNTATDEYVKSSPKKSNLVNWFFGIASGIGIISMLMSDLK